MQRLYYAAAEFIPAVHVQMFKREDPERKSFELFDSYGAIVQLLSVVLRYVTPRYDAQAVGRVLGP